MTNQNTEIVELILTSFVLMICVIHDKFQPNELSRIMYHKHSAYTDFFPHTIK